MANSASPADWTSLASMISSCNKPHKLVNFTLTCKTLPFLSPPSSKISFCATNAASSCPSILEETPTKVTVIKQLDLEVHDSQEDLLLPPRNINSFLCGLLQHAKTAEVAYDYYQKAKERKEFKPERSLLRLLIRYLVRSKKWGLIFSLSDDFVKYNVFPDSYTCSKLVYSCIRARKFRIAESLLEVFKTDPEISVLAFDSAMRGYNKLHMYSSTVMVYENMASSGIVLGWGCYCQIMKAYQKMGDIERVIALFNEFNAKELDAKQDSGQIYRILLEALGKSGRVSEAFDYFREMRKKGNFENPASYSSLICSFANNGDVDVAEELFKEAEEKKLLRDPEVFLKMVLMYIDKGLVEKTLDIVYSMKLANLRMSDCIFCAIVNGFSKKRGFRSAVKVYEKLRSEGCEAGQVTYASIINAYCRIGLYSEAEQVFLEMEQKGFDKCVVTYSTIIGMYGKTGRLRDAMRLLAKMKLKGCQPNVWIYNSLLDMHGRANDMKQVEKLWKEMKRRKVAPDKVSYTTVICAYNRAREYNMCVRFYHEYRMNGGVIDTAMAGMMVGVFSKLSQVDELLKLLQDMKSEGTQLDARLYRSALNALRDAGLQMQAQMLQESFKVSPTWAV